MPKIKGSLADVSTEYVLIEPEVYEMKLTKIDVEETKPKAGDKEYPEGQTLYIVESRVDQPGSEHHNKPVRDRIYWFRKTKEGETGGQVNEYSAAQMKRYALAIVGEDRANADDFDTDEMLNGRFQAQVTIVNFKRKDGSDGQGNELKNIVSLD